MKTVILNTDSVLNPGDAAIVLAQVRLLGRVFPGIEISLTSRTPSLDRRAHRSQDISVLSPLFPAPSLRRGIGPKLLSGLEGLLAVGPKRRMVEEIRSSDFVISTGGGLFYSNRRMLPGLTFYQNVFHVRLAQALGKPVVFFPQSFGPFGSLAARRAALRMLAHVRTARIFIRESRSFDALRRIAPSAIRDKMELCPDMALYLERLPAGTDDPLAADLPRPRLALTVRDWDFPGAGRTTARREMFNRYLRAVRSAVRMFTTRHGGSVIVVPHTRGPGDFEDDRYASRRLWALLKDDLPPSRRLFLDLPDEAPPERLMSVYASADVVLATRTHSALFALLCGRGAVSIHYQPKGLGIMEMLGWGDQSLSISGLEEGALAESLERALNITPKQKEQTRERLEALRLEIDKRLGSALKGVARRT